MTIKEIRHYKNDIKWRIRTMQPYIKYTMLIGGIFFEVVKLNRNLYELDIPAKDSDIVRFYSIHSKKDLISKMLYEIEKEG